MSTYYNDLSDRIMKAPRHELDKLEEEARKTYGGLKLDSHAQPLLDQTHYAMAVSLIESRRTK